LGIDGLSINQVSTLYNDGSELACNQIDNKLPSPSKYYEQTYFKSNNFYFVVNVIKPSLHLKNGKTKFNIGPSAIIILDKQYNVLSAVTI